MKLLGIKWKDKVPDTEVLSCASLPIIYSILMQSQIHWAEHVVRMPDHRLPKRLFYGELKQGKRSIGGQQKHYKDTHKVSLKAFNSNTNTWEQTAKDRGKWQVTVHKGAKAYKANRIAAAEQHRLMRKQSIDKPSTAATIPCPHCKRTFRAKIGLTTHLRTHRTKPKT